MYGGTRGRKKTEETRQAILRCAAVAFSERPFHEVLTEQISERLGIGKGTLYRYFGSKEELYFASILEGLRGLEDALVEVLRRPAPLERVIEELAATLIRYFWEHRDFFVLFHRHEARLDPRQREDWQKRREELVAAVASRLGRELRGRGVRQVDPRLAAEMFFGMVRAVCLHRTPEDRPQRLASLVTRMFLHGALGTPGPRPRFPAAAAAGRRRTRSSS